MPVNFGHERSLAPVRGHLWMNRQDEVDSIQWVLSLATKVISRPVCGSWWFVPSERSSSVEVNLCLAHEEDLTLRECASPP